MGQRHILLSISSTDLLKTPLTNENVLKLYNKREKE